VSVPEPVEQEGRWAGAARVSSLGIYIAICVGGCTWLGAWLDARWHTDPALTLAGALLGTASAFYGVWREVMRLGKRE
jgi:ATP synthase protein I